MYLINSSKAVVVVDQHMKVTIYDYAIIQEKCLSSHGCLYFICIKLLNAYVQYFNIVY